ncbi:MAG: hypothetical protein IH840_13660, partial [Candidatus Heimdallarchaeota archaeon]|nr:hypothetical protein [Candidatus Heimdallarchaeota archaeon]
MDLCLSTLQVTTLTGTNIQQAVEVISEEREEMEDEYHFLGVKFSKKAMPHP